MTTDQQIQGDVAYRIQCKDVSSTSTLCPILLTPKFRIRGRISYRHSRNRSMINRFQIHSEAIPKHIPNDGMLNKLSRAKIIEFFYLQNQKGQQRRYRRRKPSYQYYAYF